jgi:integration host factor subunit alpha
MTMTKKDIVMKINAEIGISTKDSVRIVESFFDIIKDDLDKWNSIMISGFGKWTVKAKKKRTGRNPATGKEMIIDARRVVTFKPSNVLRDTVNSGD